MEYILSFLADPSQFLVTCKRFYNLGISRQLFNRSNTLQLFQNFQRTVKVLKYFLRLTQFSILLENGTRFIVGMIDNLGDENNDLLKRIALNYEELKEKYPEVSGYNLPETFLHKIRRKQRELYYIICFSFFCAGSCCMLVIGVSCFGDNAFCKDSEGTSLITTGLFLFYIFFSFWLICITFWRREFGKRPKYARTCWPSDYSGCC